ncbi:hypothetical protein AG4045_020912, partial [Apium graveolens]
MEARNVENTLLTVLKEIFNIVNKNSLIAEEERGNGYPLPPAGKQILILGPGQIIPHKR